jgi:hypothetical protein
MKSAHLAGPAYDGSLGSCGPRCGARDREEIERAYRDAFLTLERRISLFLCLPLATIDMLAIKKEIDKIGHQ